jgi:hypothetical protein
MQHIVDSISWLMDGNYLEQEKENKRIVETNYRTTLALFATIVPSVGYRTQRGE